MGTTGRITTAFHTAVVDPLASCGLLVCPAMGEDVRIGSESVHATDWDDMMRLMWESGWTFKDVDDWDVPEVGVKYADGRRGYALIPLSSENAPMTEVEHAAYVSAMHALLFTARRGPESAGV